MPSPHSSSSSSSSSSGSSRSSGSSSYSSGRSSSYSSGSNSYRSSAYSHPDRDRSSDDSWDDYRGSGGPFTGTAVIVTFLVIAVIVLCVYFYNKHVNSAKPISQAPVIVAEGQCAVWDAEYGGYVRKRFVQYSDGKREYFPIEKTTDKPGEDNSWVTFHYGSDAEQQLSDLELFGREIHLTERVPGIWRITEDGGGKILVWDDGEQSYYDEDSKLWLWYNTDVKPPLWQYWYEPISGDYGKYGWMEYRNETWYIESSQGRWIEVPEKYDTSPLWHIETDE